MSGKYAVDFVLALKQTEYIEADSEDEAYEIARTMLQGGESFANLVDVWDDPDQTDWTPTAAYAEVIGAERG